MRSLRRAIGLGSIVALMAMLVALAPLTQALEEDIGLIWLFRMRGPRAVPANVAVVAIDRAAARALGQPSQLSEWPRALHARLIDLLSSAGARVVIFDLSFATPARNPDDDRALAAAMARAKNVVLLDFLERAAPGGVEWVIERLLPPHPLLADAAVAHGPFPLPKDGRVHAYWLFKPEAGGAATLPILALRVYDGGALESAGQRRLDVGNGVRFLDFYGPPRTLPTIDLHEVLMAGERGAEGAAWLRGTFKDYAVFVGFSAAEPSEQDRIRDDYPTVFTRADGLNLGGVEIAATAFANLLEDRAPHPLPLSSHLALLLGWGFLLGLVCATLRGGYAVMATLAACAVYMALAHIRFLAAAQWLPIVVPLLLQAPLALLAGLLTHSIGERRERQRLGSLVEDLLPRAVVDRLLIRTRAVAPAEKQIFGVFIMTDIEGFTSIAETMPPVEATRMLNDYFAMIFPAVENNGGSISEIAGDGMLAFWLDAGSESDARRAACNAALEIAELTSREGALPGWPPLPTRIGVHGGFVTLARVGASGHHEYRVVGDAANTASRLEALSKHLGTKLLASEDVLAGLDDLLTRPTGTFLLAGKSAPIRVRELLGLASTASLRQRQLCVAFAESLDAYGLRKWDEAAARWSAILQAYPDDGPSRFYLRLAKSQALEPPPHDWDGVVRMASK